jgi:hypothetical protein
MRAAARKIKGQSQSKRRGFASVEDDFERINWNYGYSVPYGSVITKIGLVCMVGTRHTPGHFSQNRLISRC